MHPQLIPIITLLLTGITAFLAEPHMPYVHTYVVYRYALAIIIIYAFFRFIASADKRRTAQLNEIGLLYPLRDGAFLVCTHAHIKDVGVKLGWLSPNISIETGLLSWCFILIGYYALQHPQGLPGKLINALPFDPPDRRTLCRGLILSGSIGIVGTFTATAQILWPLVPLIITILYTRRASQ